MDRQVIDLEGSELEYGSTCLGAMGDREVEMKQPSPTDDRTTSVPGRPGDPSGSSPGLLQRRRFVLTDMPVWLMLLLVALGLPRTVLADLDIVAPESSLLYYFLALTPFAAWLAVAIFRESRKPLMDFVVLGVLYGLSLFAVHQTLWDVGPSLGHRQSAAAVGFADSFSPAFHELALRGYTIMIAMAIGVGTGLIAALVAIVASAARSRRSRVRQTPGGEQSRGSGHS